MIGSFCRFILYRMMGWKKNITVVHPDKYIICLAPHTSNWDFILGQLYAHAEGIKTNFLMKKEWFFWPIGPIFKAMGGRESMKVLVDKGWANKDYAHLSFRGGRYMAEIIFKALTEE